MPVVPPPIVSPASNESDFLASHLATLLLRQPSISTAPCAPSTSAAALASASDEDALPTLTPSVSDNVLLPAAADPVSITALRIAAEEEEKARRLARNHSRKLSTLSAGASSSSPNSAALARSMSTASSPECPSTPAAPTRQPHVRSLTSFNIALAASPFTTSTLPSGSAVASPCKSSAGFLTRFGGPRRPSVDTASYDTLGTRRSSPSQCSDGSSAYGAAPASPALSQASFFYEEEVAQPHGFGFGTTGGRAGESTASALPPSSSQSTSMTITCPRRTTTTMMTSRPKLTQHSSTSFSFTSPRPVKEERPMPRVMIRGNTSEDQETLVPVSRDGRTFRFVSGATSPKAASSSSMEGAASSVDFRGYTLAAPLQIAHSSSESAKQKARTMHAQRSACSDAVRAKPVQAHRAPTSRSSSVSSASGSGWASGSGSDDASPAASEGNACPGLTPSGRTGSTSSVTPSGSSSSPDTPSDVRGPSPCKDADQSNSLKSRRARETNPLDAQLHKESLQAPSSDLAQLSVRV